MNPKKRSFQIMLRLRNERGALADVSSIISRSMTNILSGHLSVLDSHAYWSFFAESEDDDGVDAPRLRSILESSPYVEEASVVEDNDGLLVDSLCFPLRWNAGDRAVLFRQKALSDALDAVRKEFGTGGSVLLYDQGYKMGEEGARDIVERLGRKFIREHLSQVLALWSAVGWGRVSLLTYEPAGPIVVVKVEESFECAEFVSEEPYSQFLRGHLCSWLSTLFNTTLKCVETQCVSAGSEHCEFRVEPDARAISRVLQRFSV
jgi:predicted hydrocarbon binding protein